MSKVDTLCTLLLNKLGFYSDHSRATLRRHWQNSVKNELNHFVFKYGKHEDLILNVLNELLKQNDLSYKRIKQAPYKPLISHFRNKPLVVSLKEILSPVGFIADLMSIVSLVRTRDLVPRLVPNINPQGIVIDGSLTRWKLFINRKKKAILLNSEGKIIWIELEPQKELTGDELIYKRRAKNENEMRMDEVFRSKARALGFPASISLDEVPKVSIPFKHTLQRYSIGSLQRALALKVARERKPEKVGLTDIAVLRAWWFRDGNTNKRGWYEVLKKLKRVYSIQSHRFKDERVKRQRFIFKKMRCLKGSFQEKLVQTTREVNKRFPKDKPYSVATIKREYMRDRNTRKTLT